MCLRACFGGRGAGVFGEDGLILLHRQVALLEQVVHFAGGQVGFLQSLGIRVGNLADQFVGGGGSGIILLAAQ
jgi:hypothetical protein